MVATTRSMTAAKRKNEAGGEGGGAGGEAVEGEVANKRQKSSTPTTTTTATTTSHGVATPNPPSAVDITQILRFDIPAAIADLEALLASPVCRATDPSDRNGSASSSSTTTEDVLAEILGGPEALSAVLAQLQQDSDSGLNVTVPANQRIVDLLDALEPRFVAIAILARSVRHWISMSLPRIESGGNFGVDVQNSVSEMARRVEEDYLAKLQLIPVHFSERLEHLEKVTERPGFVDAVMAIRKFDVTEFERFRIYALDMKHDYEELLHYVQTNFDLIQKPRAAVGNAERTSYFG